jgi:adenylylsulfate kinase-like enzyme
VVAVTAAISPYRAVRDEVRGKVDHFVEVFVDTPIEVCEERDVKGLYEKARAGEIPEFTGVSDPYEPPLTPEVRVVTHDRDVTASAQQVIDYLVGAGLTNAAPRAEAAEARP